MSAFHNNALLGAAQPTGVTFDTKLIPKSVWMDGSGDGFTRAASDFDAEDGKEFTLGTWFQLTEFSVTGALFCAGNGSGDYTSLRHDDDNKIYFQTEVGDKILSTTALFRDSAWYHLLLSVDTTQSSAIERVLLYINGVETTLSGTYPGANHAYEFNVASIHEVGDSYENGAFQGYLAQSFMIGSKSIQQRDFAITDFLDTFTFGTNGSQFIPKAHADIKTLVDAGSDNSFLLQYQDSSALGDDISTYTNDFTATSMAAVNQTINTPSSVYPKISMLGVPSNDTAASYVMSSGSNRMTYSGSNQAAKGLLSTQIIKPTDPKIYFEFYVEAGSHGGASGGRAGAGLVVPHFDAGTSGNGFYGAGGESAFFYRGELYDNGNNNVSGFTTVAVGGVQQMAFEPSTGKVWIGANGTWRNGSATDSTTLNADNHDDQLTVQDYAFAMGLDRSGDIGVMNFGDNPTFSGNETAGTNSDSSGHGLFAYAVPSGFKAPTTANLTAPEYQGIDYFDATIYEGNGHNQRVGDFVPFEDTYAITNSVMFNNADIRRLSHTYSSESTATSDSTDQATLSFWIKFLDFADSSVNHQTIISQSNSGQTERFMFVIDNPQSSHAAFITIDTATEVNRTFTFDKDLFTGQEWSHFLLHLDTNNATAGSRMKVWINGNAITSTSDFTGMTQGLQLNLFRDEELYIGHLSPADTYNANYAFSSYLAEFHLIDGSCQAVSNFGQVDTSTNRWVPKDYKTDVGTYGNRGFYLKFDGTAGGSAGANMGKDSSGNGIHLTEENGSAGAAWAAADKNTDTPSKNFAILDIARSQTNNLTEGDLKIGPGDSNWDSTQATLGGLTRGKWYLEFTPETAGSNIQLTLSSTIVSSAASTLPRGATDYGYYFVDGKIYNNDTNLGTYGAAVGAGVVVGMAIDLDAGKLYFARNNTWENSGNPATGANPGARIRKGIAYNIVLAMTSSITTDDNIINFGASDFSYTPPTDFLAINQDNLDATADKVTAFAWIKNRDADDSHMLFDRVRGVGKDMHSDETTVEVSGDDTLRKFLQRGVQVSDDVEVNTLNESYVLWQWLVGDSTGAVTNEEGSLDSSVIAADAGHFSVVGYTGSSGAARTIGHGLGGVPEMIIINNREQNGANRAIYNKTVGNEKYLLLNSNQAIPGSGNSNYFNDTTPSSTVFTVGNGGTPDTNGNGQGMLAYCFRSVPGVCKVGQYGPNNVNNGPYIHLGFAPRWLFIKCLNTTNPYILYDNVRDSVCPATQYLLANTDATEGTGTSGREIDFLSDGFKLRENDSDINGGTTTTYIYLAMAEIGGGGTLPPIYGR